MKVHVYDTHIHTSAGEYIHFDVLVNEEHVGKVKQYATNYLASLGIVAANIKQGRCNFCHSEIANPEVQENIKNHGHSIIRL